MVIKETACMLIFQEFLILCKSSRNYRNFVWFWGNCSSVDVGTFGKPKDHTQRHTKRASSPRWGLKRSAVSRTRVSRLPNWYASSGIAGLPTTECRRKERGRVLTQRKGASASGCVSKRTSVVNQTKVCGNNSPYRRLLVWEHPLDTYTSWLSNLCLHYITVRVCT